MLVITKTNKEVPQKTKNRDTIGPGNGNSTPRNPPKEKQKQDP